MPVERPSFPRRYTKPRDPVDEKARQAEIDEFIAKRGVTKIDPPEYKPLPRHIPWTPEPKIEDLRLLAKIDANPSRPEQVEPKEPEPESQSPPTSPPPPPPKKRGRPPKPQPTSTIATTTPTPTPEPKRAGRPPASMARVHFGRMGLKLQIDYQDCGIYTEGPWRSNGGS